ncbi:anaphase-promoting complex subunit 5-domain-containing protein [Phyllosticta citribraziliensis]|uniref:Anaphase-promoting complex subunit 5 n=1 Tax=Phyllosticta citribraziliensis TaxID=989973 RepID=A0ABR1LQ18_9PEZI
MARYLNPQKISLLALTTLYCDSQVPASAVVPVLSFVTNQIISPPSAEVDATTCLGLTLNDFAAVLSPHFCPASEESLLFLFLSRLWNIDSLHALHQFFDDLGNLLLRPPHDASQAPDDDSIKLSRTSPLGMFVRRSQLEFARLQFHDASKLWMAFVSYRQPTASLLQQNSADSTLSWDKNLEELNLQASDGLSMVAYADAWDESHDGYASVDDFERLLTFQLDQLQKFGNRVPDDMRQELQRMLGPSTTIPSLAHFVKFFDSWRAGDYTSAFDNLHRYFDYTVQTREKTFYQYALLHMAILQADFGCFNEAIAAMNETIATARENQDMSCLNFGLSWLNHLAKSHPKEIDPSSCGGILGTERDGLAFLKAKAKESKNFSLLSSTLLREANMLLANGSSIPRAFEHNVQSAYLNIMHDIKSNCGAQLLMQSALYGRLGQTHLSEESSGLLQQSFRPFCPVEEVVRATCSSALTKVKSGCYSEAFEMMQAIDSKDHRTVKVNQYITSYMALLKARRAIRRRDSHSAENLLRRLRSSQPSDPTLQFDLFLLEIEHLVHNMGAYSAALQRVEAAAAELKRENQQLHGGGDIYRRIQLLILKAALFAHAGHPLKGFSAAMRAAASAHRAKLWPALWEALAVVEGALVAMGEFEAAARLGDAVIPQALEGGDQYLCGRLYALQADAHMGLAGSASQHTSTDATTTTAAANDAAAPSSNSPANQRSTRAARLAVAETMLENARESFAAVQDIAGECDAMAKLAFIKKLAAATATTPNATTVVATEGSRINDGGRTTGGSSSSAATEAVDAASAFVARYRTAAEVRMAGAGVVR